MMHHYRYTLAKSRGIEVLKGLKMPVTIRRDHMGIPFIDAPDTDDLAFAIGYVNASDRLSQMIGFKLMAEGRLSEMAGPSTLDIDVYIRSQGLNQIARSLYSSCSDRLKRILRYYSAGVNAYIEKYRDCLPPDIQLAGYEPDKWRPIDSVSVFVLLNFGLAVNLQEEIDVLNMVNAIGPAKAAWLFPIYPDEPLPFKEASKLAGIGLADAHKFDLARINHVQDSLREMGLLGIPASNNWAISGRRTLRKACIFANDTHLPLSMPSIWNLMHVRCPDYDAAGIAIAGIPGIVAGYNGHIAWGMTMVMGDNQDVFIEKIRKENGRVLYLYKDKWEPAAGRKEIFRIKGREPVVRTIYETVHGPLIGDALGCERKNEIEAMPMSLPERYDIAVSWASHVPGDKTMDAFLSLEATRSIDEAIPLLKKIRAISLNMVVADHDNIAWQVTGCFPLRKNGRGLFPSPGWTGKYDWKGFLDVSKQPHALNPSQGFICTANNRTVGPSFPYVLSSSWYYPERAERIRKLLSSSNAHTLETSMKMQLDTCSPYVAKLKDALLKGGTYGGIIRTIDGWKDASRKAEAREALYMLRHSDSKMGIDSTSACLIGALMYTYTRNTFLDELGPEDSPQWKSFIHEGDLGYSAIADHITMRGDESPFWDNVNTPEKETKAQIVANSLADAMELLEHRLGKDRAGWKWGRLHTYYWETEAYKMSRYMGLFQRLGMRFLSPFFNRGAFPAPGDHTTINVASYHLAKDFGVWLIPEMRIIVDFSRKDPLYAVNSTGQSGNPVSIHYDDGIRAWLEGSYVSFPFGEKKLEHQYTDVLTLKPEGK